MVYVRAGPLSKPKRAPPDISNGSCMPLSLQSHSSPPPPPSLVAPLFRLAAVPSGRGHAELSVYSRADSGLACSNADIGIGTAGVTRYQSAGDSSLGTGPSLVGHVTCSYPAESEWRESRDVAKGGGGIKWAMPPLSGKIK